MSTKSQYANDQPVGFENRIKKIAIAGVGGRVGTYIAKHILLNGNHTLTAITRPESTSPIPDGCQRADVNYEDQSSLVSALKGQDALIVSVGRAAPQGQEERLIDAAAAAGVSWIMPSEFGIDPRDEKLGQDVLLGPMRKATRDKIESAGISWVSLICGFWYEFSLGGGQERYGFDFKKRGLLLFDDGETKIDTSTWEQCGRAVANLFALKLLPEDENDKSPCLADFRNEFCYISSFVLNQKDMFESVKRVTGETDKDWKIDYQSSKSIFEEGIDQLKQGDMLGMVKRLYSRTFYPNGGGHHSAKNRLHNDILGLPTENLDEATKRAIEIGEKA